MGMHNNNCALFIQGKEAVTGAIEIGENCIRSDTMIIENIGCCIGGKYHTVNAVQLVF